MPAGQVSSRVPFRQQLSGMLAMVLPQYSQQGWHSQVGSRGGAVSGTCAQSSMLLLLPHPLSTSVLLTPCPHLLVVSQQAVSLERYCLEKLNWRLGPYFATEADEQA